MSTKHLCIDPGDTTGWSVWNDDDPWNFVEAGQTPAWPLIDAVIAASGVTDAMASGAEFRHVSHNHIDPQLVDTFKGWEVLVVEDWALYPAPEKGPNATELPIWDKCLTARYIGALESIARLTGRRIVLQPAKIKGPATKRGAQELFLRPLHDNRHANDSIMHWVFYAASKGLLTGSGGAA